MRRHRPLIAVLSALLLPAQAAAQAPPSPVEPAAPGEEAAPSDRDRAIERFKRGRALAEQKSWAAALAEFREALRLYPTGPVTYSAAVCLQQLGRLDEALEMYTVLLRDYGDKIADIYKQRALQEVELLRKLVGTLEIEGAVPGAAVVVNQQARGDYPLLAPLRVPAGSHIVRVYKEGHEPFETRVEVAGGATARVNAPLRRLKEVGTLQVHEAEGRALEVVVDGVAVGKTGRKALEVPLAPGQHVVYMRGEGDLGTEPATVSIRVNEVAPLRVEAEVLSASLRVTPTPFYARVSIDSVEVGRGRWEGRLRAGGHRIEVAAEGFEPGAREVSIREDARELVAVKLEPKREKKREPERSIWRALPPPPDFLELGTAVMLVPSFGGEVAGSCIEACSAGVGLGSYGALRAGWRLPWSLDLGLTAGYLTASQSTSGRSASLNVVGRSAAEATVDDALALSGLFAGLWVGYSSGGRFPVRLRLTAGGLTGAASDTRLGSIPQEISPATPLGPVSESRSTSFVMVTPEVRVGLPLRRGVEVWAGLEMPVLIAPSPPRWREDHAINAGPSGYGWFEEDALVSDVLVSFAPGIGARVDL